MPSTSAISRGWRPPGAAQAPPGRALSRRIAVTSTRAGRRRRWRRASRRSARGAASRPVSCAAARPAVVGGEHAAHTPTTATGAARGRPGRAQPRRATRKVSAVTSAASPRVGRCAGWRNRGRRRSARRTAAGSRPRAPELMSCSCPAPAPAVAVDPAKVTTRSLPAVRRGVRGVLGGDLATRRTTGSPSVGRTRARALRPGVGSRALRARWHPRRRRFVNRTEIVPTCYAVRAYPGRGPPAVRRPGKQRTHPRNEDKQIAVHLPHPDRRRRRRVAHAIAALGARPSRPKPAPDPQCRQDGTGGPPTPSTPTAQARSPQQGNVTGPRAPVRRRQYADHHRRLRTSRPRSTAPRTSTARSSPTSPAGVLDLRPRDLGRRPAPADRSAHRAGHRRRRRPRHQSCAFFPANETATSGRSPTTRLSRLDRHPDHRRQDSPVREAVTAYTRRPTLATFVARHPDATLVHEGFTTPRRARSACSPVAPGRRRRPLGQQHVQRRPRDRGRRRRAP